MRFEMAHFLQPVAQVAAVLHQALGVGIVQLFPPQGEEQEAVGDLGAQLLHARKQRHGRLVLGVFREPQLGVAANALHQLDDGFRVADDPQEFFSGNIRFQFGAAFFESRHLLFHLIESGLHFG